MEKETEYDKLKFTDWSQYTYLTPDQYKQLIDEKLERIKIQSNYQYSFLEIDE